MELPITDLSRHANDVLRALARSEDVYILSGGQVRGVIKPVCDKPKIRVQDHPFFNMLQNREPMEQQMDRLRGGRYRGL